MSSMRHRQRFGWVRALSSLVPVLTVLSASAALVLSSTALAVVAMVIGSLGTITLSVLVTRVQRQARRDVASTRAEEARAYAEQHTRTVREHREFSAHVGERLEQATNEVVELRDRLEGMQADIDRARRAGASRTSAELASAPEGQEWNELWSGLGDAPTVVDLVLFDEQSRAKGARAEAAAEDDGPAERSA
ncbi:MAG TPA: hypothetical protein VK053_15865 [Jiangellaceae bacterium]|nr:hypothetical protein [Jiangellaceae bacterium]